MSEQTHAPATEVTDAEADSPYSAASGPVDASAEPAPDVAEEYAETVSIDPTPDQVEHYLELAGDPEALGTSDITEDPVA